MVTEIVYRLFFGGRVMWVGCTRYDDGHVTETFMLAPSAPKPAWRK